MTRSWNWIRRWQDKLLRKSIIFESTPTSIAEWCCHTCLLQEVFSAVQHPRPKLYMLGYILQAWFSKLALWLRNPVAGRQRGSSQIRGNSSTGFEICRGRVRQVRGFNLLLDNTESSTVCTLAYELPPLLPSAASLLSVGNWHNGLAKSWGLPSPSAQT